MKVSNEFSYTVSSSNESNSDESSSDESSSDESSSDVSSSDESSSDESSSINSTSNESSSINSTKLLPIGEKYVRQNPNNGYVSVNDITRGTKKSWCNYKKNKNTKKFIKELKLTTNLSKYQLINGSSSHNRWIHPYIAINFCQWISPQMSVQISKFVYNFISGSFIPSEFTKYIQTMSENKILKIELELNKASFEHNNEKLKKELELNKSSFERKNEKLKKELDDLKSNKSSFELENKKLKRKLRCFKNITIDNKNIKINNSKKYDLTISENDDIILTVK